MSVCEILMLDVGAPEAHQNDRSYVCELYFRFTTQEFSMVGSYMEDLKTVKIGGWVLA